MCPWLSLGRLPTKTERFQSNKNIMYKAHQDSHAPAIVIQDREVQCSCPCVPNCVVGGHLKTGRHIQGTNVSAITFQCKTSWSPTFVCVPACTWKSKPLVWSPVHTGRGAPRNRRKQILEHIMVNRSVHTGCKQHQRICMQMCLRILCEQGLKIGAEVLDTHPCPVMPTPGIMEFFFPVPIAPSCERRHLGVWEGNRLKWSGQRQDFYIKWSVKLHKLRGVVCRRKYGGWHLSVLSSS